MILEELKYLSSLSYEKRNDININERLSQLLETSELFEKFEEFEKSLKQQGRHLRNYMSMCECLLLFIRSSRPDLWNLHLSSLNCFVKYFFAHDQINYTRLTPLYLADMLHLKESDRKPWDYPNFSVSKSNIPSTAVGSDHAMEQDNRKMKVAGGVTGLTQNINALNRFCLTAPVMNSVLQQYYENYEIVGLQHNQSTSR